MRGKASFVSALAAVVLVLCISGSVVGINYALDNGVAWAQLSCEWLDGGSFLYPADLSGAENIITGATTEANADIRLNADGSAIFNEQSNDSDFRVEGDGDANLLYVDAGNDRVYIGNNGGYTKLYVYEGGTPALPATTCQFMMQNSGASNAPAGIEIVSGTESTSHVLMGDEGAPGASMIMHDNNTDDLTLTATDDIVLDGDVIDIDGGFKAERTAISDADYQVLGTDYYVVYTGLAGDRYVDMPSTAAGDAGRVFLIGMTGHTSGTLTIRDYTDSAVSGNSTLTAVGELRHVICSGANSWYAY